MHDRNIEVSNGLIPQSQVTPLLACVGPCEGCVGDWCSGEVECLYIHCTRVEVLIGLGRQAQNPGNNHFTLW